MRAESFCLEKQTRLAEKVAMLDENTRNEQRRMPPMRMAHSRPPVRQHYNRSNNYDSNGNEIYWNQPIEYADTYGKELPTQTNNSQYNYPDHQINYSQARDTAQDYLQFPSAERLDPAGHATYDDYKYVNSEQATQAVYDNYQYDNSDHAGQTVYEDYQYENFEQPNQAVYNDYKYENSEQASQTAHENYEHGNPEEYYFQNQHDSMPEPYSYSTQSPEPVVTKSPRKQVPQLSPLKIPVETTTQNLQAYEARSVSSDSIKPSLTSRKSSDLLISANSKSRVSSVPSISKTNTSYSISSALSIPRRHSAMLSYSARMRRSRATVWSERGQKIERAASTPIEKKKSTSVSSKKQKKRVLMTHSRESYIQSSSYAVPAHHAELPPRLSASEFDGADEDNYDISSYSENLRSSSPRQSSKLVHSTTADSLLSESTEVSTRNAETASTDQGEQINSTSALSLNETDSPSIGINDNSNDLTDYSDNDSGDYNSNDSGSPTQIQDFQFSNDNSDSDFENISAVTSSVSKSLHLVVANPDESD